MQSSVTTRKSSSLFWTLFRLAYRRIWAGTLGVTVEIILWCILAGYYAFTLYDLPHYRIDGWIHEGSRYAFLGLTPLVIWLAIHKAHVSVGREDVALRGVPLKPDQILNPRMAAVFLTLLQFTAPCLIACFIALGALCRGQSDLMPHPWLFGAIQHLYLNYPEIGNLALEPPINLAWETNVVLILYALQIISWAALPLTWGFWWASNLQHRGAQFILVFASYLVMPGALYLIINRNILKLPLEAPFFFWPVTITVALSGIVLSLVFYILALKAWARRTR